MSDPQLLAPIELPLEPVPPRTQVTRLKPRGVGTLMVECLTSFLMRLAAAHHLPTGVLATRVLRPAPADRPTLAGEMPKEIVRDLRWANGVNAQAGDWVEIVMWASGVDVRNLTLLPWAAVLPAIEVVDGFIRHCPACLAAMERQGEVYEPLCGASRCHASARSTTARWKSTALHAVGVRKQSDTARGSGCADGAGSSPGTWCKSGSASSSRRTLISWR